MVVDAEGTEVRRIVTSAAAGGRREAPLHLGRHGRRRQRWCADGTYRMRVVRRDESRVIDSDEEDHGRPRAAARQARLGGAVGDRDRAARRDAERAAALRRAEEQGARRTACSGRTTARRASCAASAGGPDRTATWDGRVSVGPRADGPGARGRLRVHGRRARPGRQHHRGAAPDAARSGGAAAHRRLGARLHAARPAVRRPRRARSPHLEVGPVDRSFDFVVSRLGDPKPILRGGRVGGRFRIRVPDRMRTGVYVVRVRAGRRPRGLAARRGGPPAAERPRRGAPARGAAGAHLAGPEPGRRRRRRLRGQAAVRGLRAARPPVRGRRRCRRASTQEVSPLLRWLDRERLPYDLTTDIALARREGPALGNAPGVAFAGSELWLPDELLRRLRDYVADGGRVAAFGADSFKREVELRGDVASDPTPPRPRERARRADRAHASRARLRSRSSRTRWACSRARLGLRGRVHASSSPRPACRAPRAA